jgi:hypothetical protein
VHRRFDVAALFVAALVVFALMLWGVRSLQETDAGQVSGGGRPAPTGGTTGAASSPADYLAALQRIDAPAEAQERHAIPILRQSAQSTDPSPPWSRQRKTRPLSPAARQAVHRIAAAYRQAASQVRALAAPPAFADAAKLLARVYDDQAADYAAAVRLIKLDNGKLPPSPEWLAQLDAVQQALGTSQDDLTACRTAFKNATRTAHIAYPAWIANLINGSRGTGTPPVAP